MIKEYLVHSSWDSYYGTGVESYNIVDEDTWKELQEVIKADFGFYVHEWSGKHSEQYIEVSELDFTVLTEDPEKIETVREIFGTHVGNIDLVDYVLDRYYDYKADQEYEEDDE